MKKKKKDYSLSPVQRVGVGFVLASLRCLVLIGAFFQRIVHILKRHPKMTTGYDFSGEWHRIGWTGAVALIVLVVGLYLYAKGKRVKYPMKSRRRT